MHSVVGYHELMFYSVIALEAIGGSLNLTNHGVPCCLIYKEFYERIFYSYFEELTFSCVTKGCVPATSTLSNQSASGGLYTPRIQCKSKRLSK